MIKIKIEGEIFGRWRVLSEGRKTKNGRIKYLCECSCGVVKEVDGYNLRKGLSKSCGCLSAELTKEREKTHGLYGTKENKVWVSMLARGRHQGSNGKYYKELGVTVCKRWKEPAGQGFLNFLEDMGSCPEGMSLDRIDNRLGYYPENCQWASLSQQASNQRKSKRNTSGRVGVIWRKDQKKWRVSIRVEGVRHNIGQFCLYEDACKACTEAEINLLGYSREGY